MLVITTRGKRTGLQAEPPESVNIDCVPVDIEHIAVITTYQVHTIIKGMPEPLAQSGDID